jgi:hypothetical protein
VHRRDLRGRPERRIELLNGRWHRPRQDSGFGRCAACGGQVSEGARIVQRDGEVFHAHCAYHDGGLM